MVSPQQNRDRLNSLKEKISESSSFQEWWDNHSQLMALEEQLISEPDLHLEALQLRIHLRRDMENSLGPDQREEVSALLKQRKGEIQKALEVSEGEIESQLHIFYRFRDEIFFLIRLLKKTEGKSPPNPLKKMELEFEEMDQTLGELKKKNGTTLNKVFAEKWEARESLFLREVDQYLQEIKYHQNKTLTAAILWKLFGKAHDLLREGQWLSLSKYLDSSKTNIIEKTITRVKTARDQLIQWMGKEEFHQELLETFFDHCSSLTAKIEELPLPKAIQILEDGRVQLCEMKGLLKDSAPKDIHKKHRRFQKYFRNEEMEKKLQHRLEGIFGYSFVTFFENLILFLIFAVIGLLFVEWIWASRLTHFQKTILTWADIVICFIFLAEFFTKMFLSTDKLLYFKNHFWFDFIPSIPFGLLHLGRQADVARAGRIARLGRLARILRYIRVARPLIRIFRVFFLLLRIMDRLVKKYAPILNRNILLFSQDQPLNPVLQVSMEEEFHGVAHQISRRIRSSLEVLPLSQAAQVVQGRLHQMDLLLEKTELVEGYLDIREEEAGGQGETEIREVPLDTVIAQLLHLDETKIQNNLGEEAAESFIRNLRHFNLPLLRRLPVIRDVLPYVDSESPMALTARSGRAFGRLIEKIMGVFYFFADFHGIVTSSQLLDRLGKIMVNSTKRPTKRLLLFGAIFFLIQTLVYVLGIQSLGPATKWLSRNLGLPIVILGGICAVPLVLGSWLTHIAGQASSFYSRVAEAQYINLLKEIKNQNCRQDTHFLFSRVLPTEEEGKSEKDFQDRLISSCNLQFQKKIPQPHPWMEGHLVSLLYRDYLDGAILHSSDVKTSEQLMGNLTMDSIKRQKLKYSKAELAHLDKLDLSEGKGFFGPYIWFHFITESLAQRTARLVVEYNRNCIPLEMVPHVTPQEKESMEEWIHSKDGREKETETREEIPEGLYKTNEFTALHFLTASSHRDQYIDQRFGKRVVELLRKDRTAMVRDVFGTYPLHVLPRDERTLNPYELYQSYCSGGKIFLLPFYVIGLAFKLIFRAFRFCIQCIREILNPNLAPQQYEEGYTGFGVALRNINRMRKPLFMEALRMRCLYDYEFLGLPTPGYKIKLPSTVVDDLDFIGASPDDYRYYQYLTEQQAAKLVRFRQFLAREKLEGSDFTAKLRSLPEGEDFIQDQYAILRTLAIGYTIDYGGMASVFEAEVDLEEFFDQLLSQEDRLRGFRNSAPLFCGKKKGLFERYWDQSKFKDHEKKNQCLRAFLQDKTLQEKARTLLEKRPMEKVNLLVDEIIQHWHSWNQELLTLRTIQTMSVMDVSNYRYMVYHIGDYEKDSAPLEEFQHRDHHRSATQSVPTGESS